MEDLRKVIYTGQVKRYNTYSGNNEYEIGNDNINNLDNLLWEFSGDNIKLTIEQIPSEKE